MTDPELIAHPLSLSTLEAEVERVSSGVVREEQVSSKAGGEEG
jgi:hypothetical protein